MWFVKYAELFLAELDKIIIALLVVYFGHAAICGNQAAHDFATAFMGALLTLTVQAARGRFRNKDTE